MKHFRGTFVFAFIVLAVGAFAVYELNRSGKEEESKQTESQVFNNLRTNDISEFKFNGFGRNISAEKSPNGWILKEPLQDVVDDQAIEEWMSQIIKEQVEVVDSEGKSLNWEQYGLTVPITTIQFKSAQGQINKIEVGSVRSFDQGYYIRRNGENELLVGSKNWETVISKTHMDVLNKKIILPKDEITYIKLRTPTAKGEIELSFKDGFWIYLKNDKIKLDQLQVKEFVTEIRNLRADELIYDDIFKQKLSVQSTHAGNTQIELKWSDAKIEPIKIGLIRDENNQYALLASKNVPAFKISANTFQVFAKDLMFFRDKKFPFQFDDGVAAQFSILRNDKNKSRHFVKTSGVWGAPDTKSDNINSETVINALKELKDLEVQEFAGGESWVAKNSESISIRNSDNKEYFKLEFATINKKNAKFYLAKTTLSDQLILVDKVKLDQLLDQNFFKVDEKP